MVVELNPEQALAANHVEGPLLVLAGAGSGKTRVVTHRIGRLLDLGVPASDILAVTFTNKAADEMRARIRAMKNTSVLACTFHSLGARILRESISALGYRSDFVIYDEDDSEKLLKACLEQLSLQDEKGLLKELRGQISFAKNELQEPSMLKDSIAAQVYALYQKKLQECNALDFDDLLYLSVKLLHKDEAIRTMYQNRWVFLLIDEYQDTNFAQYQLTQILVAKHRNLFAVGDPDQSIYSWRGAKVGNILNFKKDFPDAQIVLLEQNYRSSNHILKASNHLIGHNLRRYDKKLWSAMGDGEKIGLFIAPSEKEEAAFTAKQIRFHNASGISLQEMAIFYRTNAQSRTFEDALLSHRIPYKIVGGLSFYARREIKDVLAFLKLLLSDADLISFWRTINIPKRGLGKASLEKIEAGALAAEIPILTFCRAIPASIKLSAKQREALASYISLIDTLRQKRASLKIHELITETLAASNYQTYLEEDPDTLQDRKENLDELIGKATEWEEEHETPSLQLFLEELSLRSNTDEKTEGPAVQLMTLHNSKGLEFPVVFLAGLEEELCPHANAKEEESAIEEERRLCYVGMTRAKQFLYLTASTYRFLWGIPRRMRPSRFLKEIPTEHLRNLNPGTFAPSSEVFASGDKVCHPQFGSGVVENQFEGPLGLTYEIFFPEAGLSRTLVARFARLQRE
jgi:DNA helicase-2/ATP-dependent DNA helicase PcrA